MGDVEVGAGEGPALTSSIEYFATAEMDKGKNIASLGLIGARSSLLCGSTGRRHPDSPRRSAALLPAIRVCPASSLRDSMSSYRSGCRVNRRLVSGGDESDGARADRATRTRQDVDAGCASRGTRPHRVQRPKSESIHSRMSSAQGPGSCELRHSLSLQKKIFLKTRVYEGTLSLAAGIASGSPVADKSTAGIRAEAAVDEGSGDRR